MDKFIKGFMQFLRGCMFFFIGMFLIAPLIGTMAEITGIGWNFLIWSLVVVLSLVFAFFMMKTTLFSINGVKDLLAYGLVFIISGMIYVNYSPDLEVRQDPSVYLFKAMNLCNYGTTYRDMDIYTEMAEDGVIAPLDSYADIENGTMYKDGKLHTDFYPGGAYFYAMIGLVSKRLMFYGKTIIMMMNALLIFELLSKMTKKKSDFSNVLFTIAFIIAPIIVWFGRGSFSEPVAMLYVLLLALLFIDKEKVPLGIFALAIISSYNARIDYLLVMIVAIFVLNYISTKWAVITTALGCAAVIIYSKVYWIYYDRIINSDMKLLRYSVVLLIIGLIISLLVKKFWKKLPEFYRSDLVTVIFVALGIGLALLAFRDNVVTEYKMADIHGNYMRTYAEDVMDMLFMVFPSIFIVGGLIGLFKIQRNKEIEFEPGVFILGITAAYSYFFVFFGNSPQLYWGLRRYYNILLPVLFISFVILINEVENKVRLILSLTCLIISANMFYDSKQIPDYKNLDKCVIAIDEDLKNRNIDCVLYDTDLRYTLSSVISYSDIDFIPVTNTQISDAGKWLLENGYENSVYMSAMELECQKELYNITYKKQGESYNQIPTTKYKKSYNFYSYKIDEVMDLYENIDTIIYAKGIQNVKGQVYSDGWIGNSMILEELNVEPKGKSLVIQRCGYNNYFFDENELEEMDLKVIINNEIEIDEFIIEENEIFVNTDAVDNINSIEINCNTFNPADVGAGEDTRDLGLDVNMIYIEK